MSEGVAFQVLTNLDVNLNDIREVVLELLGSSNETSAATAIDEQVARLRTTIRTCPNGPTRELLLNMLDLIENVLKQIQPDSWRSTTTGET